MNEEGEYIKGVQCPYCIYSYIIDKMGYPGCILIDKKNECARFKKNDKK